jgi:hypothetical protein
MEYIPQFLLEDPIFKAVYEGNLAEAKDWQGDIEDLRDQCFVDTATWGLDLWEGFLGIEVDHNKSYESRRENIKAKLRGIGTLTKELIESVANSYSNGAVEVRENVRNRVPPFTSGQWDLSGNTTILNSDYEINFLPQSIEEINSLKMDAIGDRYYRLGYNIGDNDVYLVKDVNSMNIVDVNNAYLSKFSGKDANSFIKVSFLDESDNLISDLIYKSSGSAVEKFKTPENTRYIKIELSNYILGDFAFKNLFLFEGDEERDWIYHYPYKYTIKFIDEFGIPDNLEDIKNSLEEIKPSHLDILYQFRYLLVNDVSVMTINEINSKKLSNFAGGNL